MNAEEVLAGLARDHGRNGLLSYLLKKIAYGAVEAVVSEEEYV